MRGGRVMLVGLDGCGKSTLADVVEGAPSDHRHREDCYYRDLTLEVPGRYVENHWMHNIVIMLAQNQASALCLLVDAATLETYYSSGFAKATTVPSVGLLTKCDQVSEEARERGLAALLDAGVGEAWCLSTATGEGLERFSEWAASVASSASHAS